jgi:hypothetical protein
MNAPSIGASGLLGLSSSTGRNINLVIDVSRKMIGSMSADCRDVEETRITPGTRDVLESGRLLGSGVGLFVSICQLSSY